MGDEQEEDMEDFRLLFRGKELRDEQSLSALSAGIAAGLPCTVRVMFRLLGGKGGFGALLKKQMSQGKKTTNFDAMRDLSGRRLRHSKAVDRIKEWMEKKKRDDDLVNLIVGEGPELPKTLEKHETLDEEYLQRLKRTAADRAKVVSQGMKVAFEEDDEGPAKKMRSAAGEFDGVASSSSSSSVPLATAVSSSASAASSAAAGPSAAAGSDFLNALGMLSGSEEEGSQDDGEAPNGAAAAASSSSSSAKAAGAAVAVAAASEIASSSSTSARALASSSAAATAEVEDEEDDLADEAALEDNSAVAKAAAAAAQAEKDRTAVLPSLLKAWTKPDKASASVSSKAVAAPSASSAAPAVASTGEVVGKDAIARFGSAEELARNVSPDDVKLSLQHFGMKCGGKPEERAARLFLLKSTPVEKLPKAVLAAKK